MANNFDKNLGDKKHLLSQFKLRTQMLFGYAIPVFMFAVSTYIVYSNANKVFEAFNQVENVQKILLKRIQWRCLGVIWSPIVGVILFLKNRNF